MITVLSLFSSEDYEIHLITGQLCMCAHVCVYACVFLSVCVFVSVYTLSLQILHPMNTSKTFFYLNKPKCVGMCHYKEWEHSNSHGPPLPSVMPSPQHFDGHALVWWREPEVTIAIPWYMGLMFRTRQSSGILLQANAGDFSKMHLLVSKLDYANIQSHVKVC